MLVFALVQIFEDFKVSEMVDVNGSRCPHSGAFLLLLWNDPDAALETSPLLFFI